MTARQLSRNQFLVKICGVRSYEAAEAVASAGADLLGLNFAPVRREISPLLAGEIVMRLRSEFADSPLAVGLFVEATPTVINSTAAIAGLDFVQLHGILDPDSLAEIEVPVIRSLRTAPGVALDELRREIESLLSAVCPPIAIMIDGYDSRQHGGMGVRADWELSAVLASDYPVILAGGLNADSVNGAIEQVRPWGVDVSSGVETDGSKDVSKIAAFIAAARDGFSAIT